MQTDDRGMGKLLEYIFSSEPGSFVFWGLIAFVILTRKNKSWVDHDAWIPFYRRDDEK